jgi:hypothetical protein
MYLSNDNKQWLDDWAKRIKITIDNTNIDSDLTHFPVPIVLGTSVGQSDQDVSDIFDELGANSLKIAITKSDGTTQIYGEIEQWDTANEKALIWVSKSDLTLSASSTNELYFYYDVNQPDNTDYIGTAGNRTEVWNSSFAAVYTMAQDPSGGTGCIIDSSSNTNHGTPYGSMTGEDLVSGLIGKAIEFDGLDDAIVVPNTYDFNSTSATIEIVSNINARLWAGLVTKQDNTYSDWAIRLDNTTGELCEVELYPYTEYLRSTTKVGAGGLKHISVVFDGTSNKGALYLDAVAEMQNVSISFNNTHAYPISIGYDPRGGDEYITGSISSVRISKTALSAAWIKADYHAQTDNLITWGDEEYRV